MSSSQHRTVIIIDDGSDVVKQLKLVVEFMGVNVHMLFIEDCLNNDGHLPGFVDQARLCFINYNEDNLANTFNAIDALLKREVRMPFVLMGHGGNVEDMSFVISGFLKIPTFDQLQQQFYAADAHWNRLSKTHALQGYIIEEIEQVLADIGAGVDNQDVNLQALPVASKVVKNLNENSLKLLDETLVGHCEPMQHVKQMIVRVHDKNASVLITGESGTGKEVVARILHDLSPRRNKAFVPVNCGAIPAELLESELFGHEKGAFTGAIAARAGRFEIAEGGTIFLDEIGDMPLNMQVKILRVLQERIFERVGATKSRECDVRVIAATHRNLDEMIENNTFRADLFYRLNVFPIEVPALRERVTDLPLLIPVLVKRLGEQHQTYIEFNQDAIESLARHPWPGNIRELSNLLERLLIMYPEEVITISHLPSKYRYSIHGEALVPNMPEPVYQQDVAVETAHSTSEVTASERAALFAEPETMVIPQAEIDISDGIDLKEHVATIEKTLIQRALDESEGIVARAAELLQMRRTTLVEKMRKYDMSR